MSLRHVNTLESLVKRLQSDKDALNEKYSSGFIDGFTVELLGKTNCLAFGLRPGWKRSLLGWSRMPGKRGLVRSMVPFNACVQGGHRRDARACCQARPFEVIL